jgi:hypothetical protein
MPAHVDATAAEKEVAMQPIPHETSQRLSLALGEAVVRIWSHLPQNVQQGLFEEAVAAHGEDVRSELALFLHDKHPRTAASIKARAMIEPDSLGG